MTRISWLGFLLGVLCLFLHFPPLMSIPFGFGTDALLYFSRTTAFIIFALTLVLIFPVIGSAVFSRIFSSNRGLPSLPAWLYGLAGAGGKNGQRAKAFN